MGSDDASDLHDIVTVHLSDKFKAEHGIPPLPDPADFGPRRWTWRNLRSAVLQVELIPTPWDWKIAAYTADDDPGAGGYSGKRWILLLGPVNIILRCHIGYHGAMDGWRDRFWLDEMTAYERSKPVR